MTVNPRVAPLLAVIALGSITLAGQARPPAAGQARSAAAAPAVTGVHVTPGDLVVDPPTLINLGFEWLMQGDDNRNASVDVSYRKVDETAWKKGMPLLRLHGEKTTQPNVFNYYCGAGDTAPGGRPRVKPGDIILMHAGTYAYQYEYYANQTTINATTTFEGTYYLTAKGTPEKPIVIKGAGDGEVIIDGRNNFNLFNMKVADYNYIEGITFRNTGIAIWAGTQFIAGAKGITVKHCRFEQVGLGVFSNYSGSSNFYIADNVVLGKNDSQHL